MRISVKYPFNSLEDYLASRPLDIDGILDDGWGSPFPVKGREIEAAIVFIDIGGFTRRTAEFSPIETLIFVNNFFTWISAEGLRGTKGIVDKYIGDEMMIIFSKDFGSEDPFADALNAAISMVDKDVLSFCPHVGISMGQVVVGYVGTPMKYNCSVFGRPVSVASRCCGIEPNHMKSIFLPTEVWGDRKLSDFIKPRIVQGPGGEEIEEPSFWGIEPSKKMDLKNLPGLDVIEIYGDVGHFPTLGADDIPKIALDGLKKEGSYRPWRYDFEPPFKGTAP